MVTASQLVSSSACQPWSWPPLSSVRTGGRLTFSSSFRCNSSSEKTKLRLTHYRSSLLRQTPRCQQCRMCRSRPSKHSQAVRRNIQRRNIQHWWSITRWNLRCFAVHLWGACVRGAPRRTCRAPVQTYEAFFVCNYPVAHQVCLGHKQIAGTYPSDTPKNLSITPWSPIVDNLPLTCNKPPLFCISNKFNSWGSNFVFSRTWLTGAR
mmetsp:Transcript_101846/g.164208  ORF Transcript_101846/g.164208 Transcript_101846/m.164208 type:complete len:207 (+) Transcript_101846:467-1087(+)